MPPAIHSFSIGNACPDRTQAGTAGAWNKKLAMAAGLSLALLASGCARLPNPFAPDTSAARVFTVGYENLSDRYIEAVIPADLAIAGLSNLSAVDETVSVRREGGMVRLQVNGETVFSQKSPPPDDAHGWGALTANALAEARNASEQIYAQKPETLIKMIFGGVLTDMDKFSRYSGPDAASLARASREGFGGLGITIKTEQNVTTILHVHPNTPALRGGLKAKDSITHVNGEAIEGLSQTEVIHLLRGPIDETVELRVLRAPAKTALEISLVRAHIIPPTVTARRDDGILEIKISSFNQGTTRSLRQTVIQAEREMGLRLRGLILDLRNNPGGLLDQAVAASNLFMRGGRIISTAGRHPDSAQIFDATSGEWAAGLPIVVLINGKSASASEIMAVALRDSGRAAIIGSTSFGKGTVQTIIRLPNGGEMVITWARIHAPSGQTLDQQGLVPVFCTHVGKKQLKHLMQSLGRRQEGSRPISDALWPRSLGPHYSKKAQAACPSDRARPAADFKAARLLLDNIDAYYQAVVGEAPSIAKR